MGGRAPGAPPPDPPMLCTYVERTNKASIYKNPQGYEVSWFAVFRKHTLQHTLEKYVPVPIWREKFQKYWKFCVQEHFGYLAHAIILGVYSSARNIIVATE